MKKKIALMVIAVMAATSLQVFAAESSGNEDSPCGPNGCPYYRNGQHRHGDGQGYGEGGHHRHGAGCWNNQYLDK